MNDNPEIESECEQYACLRTIPVNQFCHLYFLANENSKIYPRL